MANVGKREKSNDPPTKEEKKTQEKMLDPTNM